MAKARVRAVRSRRGARRGTSTGRTPKLIAVAVVLLGVFGGLAITGGVTAFAVYRHYAFMYILKPPATTKCTLRLLAKRRFK